MTVLGFTRDNLQIFQGLFSVILDFFRSGLSKSPIFSLYFHSLKVAQQTRISRFFFQIFIELKFESGNFDYYMGKVIFLSF